MKLEHGTMYIDSIIIYHYAEAQASYQTHVTHRYFLQVIIKLLYRLLKEMVKHSFTLIRLAAQNIHHKVLPGFQLFAKSVL